MSMPEEYRNTFIAQLHNALSGYTGLDVDEAVRCVSFSILHAPISHLVTDSAR